MTVYINNSLVNGLEQHTTHALRLCTTEEQRRVIGNIKAMVDYIKKLHEEQNKKITDRCNKMRKVNKYYGRPKPKRENDVRNRAN